MTKTEERVAQIFDECGLVKNIIEWSDINEELKELEKEARKARPQAAKKTESLSKFLPKDKSKRLEELRFNKQQNRQKEDKIFSCATKRLKKENIILITTDKGIFAEKLLKLKESIS